MPNPGHVKVYTPDTCTFIMQQWLECIPQSSYYSPVVRRSNTVEVRPLTDHDVGLLHTILDASASLWNR